LSICVAMVAHMGDVPSTMHRYIDFRLSSRGVAIWPATLNGHVKRLTNQTLRALRIPPCSPRETSSTLLIAPAQRLLDEPRAERQHYSLVRLFLGPSWRRVFKILLTSVRRYIEKAVRVGVRFRATSVRRIGVKKITFQTKEYA
jgi:hypothetical protein